MDKYKKEATVYPAIAGMIIPMLLTSEYICTYLPKAMGLVAGIATIIGVFISVGLVYSALGYWIRSVFIDISKFVFRWLIIKEDEANMPTTQLLLWNSPKRKSESDIKAIAEKVRNDFGISLYTIEEETANPKEATRIIVDAVGKMREVTRTNKNLQQYNRRFGFTRNYIGTSVIAILLIVMAMGYNFTQAMGYDTIIIVALILQILFTILPILMLKAKGFDYATALFNAYMTTNV